MVVVGIVFGVIGPQNLGQSLFRIEDNKMMSSTKNFSRLAPATDFVGVSLNAEHLADGENFEKVWQLALSIAKVSAAV